MTMLRSVTTMFGLLALLVLSACNTVEGVGEDVQSGGEAISDTADTVKQKI